MWVLERCNCNLPNSKTCSRKCVHFLKAETTTLNTTVQFEEEVKRLKLELKDSERRADTAQTRTKGLSDENALLKVQDCLALAPKTPPKGKPPARLAPSLPSRHSLDQPDSQYLVGFPMGDVPPTFTSSRKCCLRAH